jgi:hypothetical protein
MERSLERTPGSGLKTVDLEAEPPDDADFKRQDLWCTADAGTEAMMPLGSENGQRPPGARPDFWPM